MPRWVSCDSSRQFYVFAPVFAVSFFKWLNLYSFSKVAEDDPPSLRYGATRKAATCC
jgi:hypothetical protein